MNINKGDTIKITRGYQEVTGIVDTAVNWGTSENPDWYIEFHSSEGPCYWKQQYDGGTVEVL